MSRRVGLLVAAPAVLLASCGDPGTAPYGRTVRLSGFVIPVDAVYLTGSVQVTVRTSPVDSSTALADSTGAFHIDVHYPSAATDSVDVTLDAPRGAARVYHPVHTRVVASELERALSRPLVVGRVTGHYTPTFGTNIRVVSLVAAFARPCADTTNVACDSFFPQAWLTKGTQIWSHGAAPVPVAFDRARSTTSISATDSVAFWTAANRMTLDLGWPVFRPATLSSLGQVDANGTVAGAILVVVDGALAAGAEAVDRFTGPIGLSAVRVKVARESDLASRGRVTHVLFHALGFGHTCAWPSVLGGVGCAAVDSITAEDAISWALADQIDGTMLIFKPTIGLAASLRGERELEPPSSVPSGRP